MHHIRAAVIVAWLAFAMFGLIYGRSVEAKALEQRDVGDWRVVAVASDSGDDEACYALGAVSGDGPVISFLIDANQEWYLGLYDKSWKLSEGEERDLTYAIDGGSPTAVTAYQFGPEILRIALGVNFAVTEPMRHGNRLDIRYKKGGRASFSLKGSSNALDALLACATRHLNYRDDPDIERIGNWLVLRVPHEDGTCRAAIAGENDILFTFHYDPNWGYFVRISHRKDQWRLREGDKHVLTYHIDDGAPVEVSAGVSANTVLLPLGKNFASLKPFEDGRVLQVQAAQQNLTVDLRDATRAFAALQACAQRLIAPYAAVADPFSPKPADAPGGSIGIGSAASGLSEAVMPDAHGKPLEDDPQIEQVISTAKLLRMTRIVFTYDFSAESELRERLRAALALAPADDNRAEIMQAVVQPFLAEYLEKALKAAPPDALAKMVQHDRDVLRQLQSQPESCAAYFKANGTGDFSYLPKEMRLAQAEVYADVIEAAMQRPTHISPASDEQLVAWMGEAYARLGYPAEDITRLAQLDTLDAGEVCRVAIQFTSAMGSLGDTEATQVYRASLQ